MNKLESVSLDDARRVIEAGERKAREIGQPSNVAVVDAGGNLVAHIRMDGYLSAPWRRSPPSTGRCRRG